MSTQSTAKPPDEQLYQVHRLGSAGRDDVTAPLSAAGAAEVAGRAERHGTYLAVAIAPCAPPADDLSALVDCGPVLSASPYGGRS